MSKKIETLTKEQQDKFPYYREKWLAIGKSCEPADFEECKKYARLAYEAAGLTCPETFYLVDSPIAAIELDVKLHQNENNNGENAADIPKLVDQAISNQIYGYHEAGWLSFYDFFLNECNLEVCKRLEGLMGLAKNCGWWSPYDTCVIFQHRHSELHTDAQHRLHNEIAPAVRYRDGFSVWAIDGVILDEQVVLRPETLTLEQINSTLNQEIRAIMINRYGWLKYLEESKAKCIDNRYNEIEGTKEALYVTPGTRGNGHMLIATCTTGRIFHMSVPNSIKTCAEAQVWLGPQHLLKNRRLNVIGRT